MAAIALPQQSQSIAGVIPLPALPASPPNPNDITAAFRYVKDVKMSQNMMVTTTANADDNDVVEAEIYKATIINSHLNATAPPAAQTAIPPWAQQLIQAVDRMENRMEDRLNRMEDRLNRIEDRLNIMDGRLNGIEYQMEVERIQRANSFRENGARFQFDIINFRDGTTPAQHNLPLLDSGDAILQMSGRHLTQYLERYNLPRRNQVDFRKRDLAIHIGCSVKLI